MSDLDTLLGEALIPAHVSYDVARQEWDAWLAAHPLPTNTELDARLADPATRAGFVAICRERGIYHLPTAEFVSALAGLLRQLPEPWLEVGAGRGDLARATRAAGVPLIATDDGSWWPGSLPNDVELSAIATALERHSPGTVLCVWPPRDTDWPSLIRACPSVRAYLLIGGGPRGMTGDTASWSDAPGWQRRWLPHLAALGRCRLDAGGDLHTHALLMFRSDRSS